jgi:hypothetical protein
MGNDALPDLGHAVTQDGNFKFNDLGVAVLGASALHQNNHGMFSTPESTPQTRP